MSFKSKVIIVTGASSGMGAATALDFAAEGATLVLVGRDSARLNKVAAAVESKSSKPLAIVADVSILKDCERIINETLKKFGKIDILVNNAGTHVGGDILDADALETYNFMIATNLHSVVYMTHLAAPHLVKTKGNIVNISSAATLTVWENCFAYTISKAGVDHLTRATALELAPKGVRVNVVNPGLVRTGVPSEKLNAMFEVFSKQSPLKKCAEATDISSMILYLASDKAKSITGSTFVIDNGSLLTAPIDAKKVHQMLL